MEDQNLVAKRIVGTNALVDGFRFQSPEFPTYFLTHAHSDHTTGLTRGFCAGTIYCSPVTAALIIHDTPRVRDQARVVALEVGKTHKIRDGKCGSFEVTLVDANHCPGACVLVFDVPLAAGDGGDGDDDENKEGTERTRTRRIVHTGDFRFHSSLHGGPPLLLSSPLNPGAPIDTLLLDTTYAHPRHDHPGQELAIRACAEFCRREAAKSISPLQPLPSSVQPRPQPRPLFVFGSYRIGKERLYLGVAEELGWKIWVPPQKRRLLELLGLLSDGGDGGGGSEKKSDGGGGSVKKNGGGGESGGGERGGGESGGIGDRKTKLHLHRRYPRSLLADSPTAAVLHVAPMGASLTPPALLSRLEPGGDAPASGCGRVVGIRPTGWTWRKPKKGGARDKAANAERDLCSALVSSYSPLPNVTVAGVPYSEHSSFPELRAAVAAMKPRRLVPTVTGGTAGDREAIVQRFSDLLDRKRDRSRLDFFFSSKKKDEEEEKASAEEEDEGGEFFEVKVEDGKCAAAAVNNDDIEGKEERGSDDEGDDDDSWGPLRGGDEWALDDDEDEETKEEEGEARKKKEREKAAAAAGGPSAAPLPPPPLPPPPPVPFDLSSVDAQEQRRILAEIHAVATAEKLLRDQREGNGKRRRQPTLAAFAAATAAGKKKKE